MLLTSLYASFLLKNEVKNTSPFTVVIAKELSKMIALNLSENKVYLFSIFTTSFFGICKNVFPKNTFAALK